MRNILKIFLIQLLSLSVSSLLIAWEYKGVCYDADWENRDAWYGTPTAARQLNRLKEMGANALSVTPFAYQKDVTKPTITFKRELDPGLKADIKKAKELGLKVVLKPHIWSNQFWDGSGHWHGSIAMNDQAEWKQWFESYKTMIVHFAKEARDLKADLFVVGIEYEKTTAQHTKEWEEIIREVREVYPGPLTYAAHGLEEARQIKFWDSLDVIGINAYLPVADSFQPTVEQLKRSWTDHKKEFLALSKAKGNKKIVFTEVGYSSARGTAQKPYEWPSPQSVQDQQEQARCYEALFESFKAENWFEGLFIWKFKVGVTPAAESREPSEALFVFQDKPAEQVIRRYFLELK